MTKTRSAPGASASLKACIDQKIAQIRSVEQDFPGAIIIHNLKDSTVVYMNTWGLQYLGVTIDQLHKMGTEYHNYFFNPDDAKDYVPKILGLLERNNDDEFVCFFQQVRKSPKHEWVWYLSSTRIFFRDGLGTPLLTLTMALPVDAQHHIANKARKMIEENNLLLHAAIVSFVIKTSIHSAKTLTLKNMGPKGICLMEKVVDFLAILIFMADIMAGRLNM